MNQALHILVFDDDAVDRKMIRRHLTAADLSISESGTVEQALAVLRASPIDCILLDYNLPEVNGIEFLAQLRDMLPKAPPAIIMMTGNGSERLVVEAMRNGVKDYLVKADITQETLLRAVFNAIEATEQDQKAEEENRRLEELALVDPLTGIGNRRFFDIRLDHALRRARRQSENISLLFMDLDGFKQVNDRHGHAAGDRVLCEVARRLGQTARDADTLVRLGGDEFAVMMETGVSHSGAEILARRIEEAVAEAFLVENGIVRIGVSLGIAHFPDDGDTPGALLKAADVAMYGKKNSVRKSA